ncbi:DDE transposase, partial [Oceanidesulfovibrio indonesiensis]
MALGKQSDRNGKMFVAWDEIPKSPGHVFYDRLQSILTKNRFDRFAEELCAPFYSTGQGRPSV